MLAEVGAGRHPDGKPGATTWLAIGSGRTTIYADSPEHLTLTDFHPGDPVTFERYGGTLTRASADGISLTTYDNPSWTASNFWILFDMVAGAAALMMAASAALWIRYFRRPHPDDMLADGSSGSFELAS